MIHAHVTTWFLGLILFFISVYLLKKGNEKGQKIVHMILRLFYILILITGAYLVFSLWQFHITAVIKGLVGLWVIYTMEFILVRGVKGQPTKSFWIQFIISIIAVLVLGYGIL